MTGLYSIIHNGEVEDFGTLHDAKTRAEAIFEEEGIAVEIRSDTPMRYKVYDPITGNMVDWGYYLSTAVAIAKDWSNDGQRYEVRNALDELEGTYQSGRAV